jgi:hypothetical protein
MTQKNIVRRIKEWKKIKELEMNPQDPYWSMYELDQTYNKLNQIHSELYLRFFIELEKRRLKVCINKNNLKIIIYFI